MAQRVGEQIWKLDAGATAFATLPKGDLLLRYQQREVATLFDGCSLLAIEKSRRIGLTWALASYAVLKAAAEPGAGGMNVWYMGYDLDMAREFVDACAMWAKAFGFAADAVGEEIIHDERGDIGSFRIRFASGFKITGLPSVPRALRGKQGVVIIDEAAFHRDLAEVLKAAMALLIWGGQVVVVSTHDGEVNPFNLLLQEIRAGRRKGTVHTITFDDAIADGLYERVELVAKVKRAPILPKDAWIKDIRDTYGEDAEEELDCIPKQGAGSFLDPVKLAACCHPDAGKPELYSGGLYYLGRDVARRRDLPVLHGYESVGDILWMRDRWLERGATFLEQDQQAARLMNSRRVVSYWIDQTGMGEKVVEDEQRKYGESRVTGVLLTGPSRLDLAYALRDRVERQAIRFCTDPALVTDLRAIKKKGGVGGSISLVNEGEVHADEFWAAALACRAASIGHQPYAYHSVRDRDDHDRSPLSRRRDENEGLDDGGGFRGYRF